MSKFNKEKEEKEKEMTESNETKGISLENTKCDLEQKSGSGDNTSEKSTSEPQLDLTLENQKIKEKLKELENKYLRALADYQNLQKRTQQEKNELYKFASQKTIELLLPALDTFEYARSTLKPESKTEKIIEDFNLVFEMLLKSLKDIGLEVIEETGIPFNPHFHEPLHQIPTNELPDHTIMQVLKKGYMLNKKVIRPALVSVSIKQEEKSNND